LIRPQDFLPDDIYCRKLFDDWLIHNQDKKYFHNVMRKNIVVLASLFVLLAISCKENKQQAPPPGAGANAAPLQVEGQVIKPVSINEMIEVSGTILANESTEIRPEISGRITQLNISEGALVKKGSLLVKLYDADLQAELRKLQVQLQIADKTEERQSELLKIGGIAQQDYDLSLLQVSNIKADMELIRVNIGKTEIRAPYSGRLGLKNISPGAYIAPSNIITTITQIDRMKIEFSVPEKYSSQIQNGKSVEFSLEGSGKKYNAIVIAKESSIEESTRNLRIRAVVDGNDQYLVPGTFAKVNMILGENKNAIMIPSNSIIPQARNKQVVVFTGGSAKFLTVTTGIRDSASVQVLTGLNIGDTLITTGLLFVKPGSNIHLTKIVN
jgi:membrane fusion protein, multidrug efflux system